MQIYISKTLLKPEVKGLPAWAKAVSLGPPSCRVAGCVPAIVIFVISEDSVTLKCSWLTPDHQWLPLHSVSSFLLIIRPELWGNNKC